MLRPTSSPLTIHRIVSQPIDLFLLDRSTKPLGDCDAVRINVAAVAAVLPLSPTGLKSLAGAEYVCEHQSSSCVNRHGGDVNSIFRLVRLSFGHKSLSFGQVMVI